MIFRFAPRNDGGEDEGAVFRTVGDAGPYEGNGRFDGSSRAPTPTGAPSKEDVGEAKRRYR